MDYVDCTASFLTPDGGTLDHDKMPDGLHPVGEGARALLASAMRPARASSAGSCAPADEWSSLTHSSSTLVQPDPTDSSRVRIDLGSWPPPALRGSPGVTRVPVPASGAKQSRADYDAGPEQTLPVTYSIQGTQFACGG